MQKIEEASRKKDEQTTQFISATRDALEQKMENYTEKREAYITDLKTKLKVVFLQIRGVCKIHNLTLYRITLKT